MNLLNPSHQIHHKQLSYVNRSLPSPANGFFFLSAVFITGIINQSKLSITASVYANKNTCCYLYLNIRPLVFYTNKKAAEQVCSWISLLVIWEGFEPPTHGLEGRCSILLSYQTKKIGAGDGNRTHNISLEGWGFTTKLHPQFTKQCYMYLVGAAGFEPATPCSQGRCSTKLSHAPNTKDII